MMPKVSRKSKSSMEISIVATLPWTCTNFGNQSEIEAYVKATGTWETIATVHVAGGVDAEDIAGFIVQAVNDREKVHSTLQRIPLPFEGDVAAAVASPQRDNSVLTGKPPSSDLKR